MRTPYTHDITETMRGRLGVNNVAAKSIVDAGRGWDVAIGGLGFHLITSDQNPLDMQTADFQRQQLDTAKVAGDQTLTGAWTRSAMSFHGGTGLLYADLRDWDPLSPYRYADSRGIDPWTEGQLGLLFNGDFAHATTNTPYVATVDINTYLYVDGANLYRVTGANAPVLLTSNLPSSATSLATNGTSWFVGLTTGVYSGSVDNVTVGASIYTIGGGKPVLLRVVKDRLFAAVGTSIYELTFAGGALPTALYTHPNVGWQWTAICETQNSILAVGRAGGTCTIHKFTLDATGLLPTIAKPSVTGELPRGETVNDAASYLSTYLILATTAGVRIAALDSNGGLTYGPLLVLQPGGMSGIGFYDKQVWVGSPATGELWRIDLSRPMQEQVATYSSYYSPVASRYASSRDMQMFTAAFGVSALASGNITSMAMLGDRPVVAVTGQGVWRRSATVRVPYGTLDTPKYRFGTTINKRFLSVNLVTALQGVAVGVSVLGSDGSTTALATFQTSVNDEPVSLASILPVPYVALRWTLTGNGGTGVVTMSYQIRALPAPRREWLWQLPLMLFDEEVSQLNGVRVAPGDPMVRLRALKQIESSGQTVIVQFLAWGERFVGSIEKVQFRSTTPPSLKGSGTGGVCNVILREVTA